MMRKLPSVRLAVESLDSRLLLSTISPAGGSHTSNSAHIHAERHAAVPAPATTVDLQGTIVIVTTFSNNDSQATSVGSGNLGAVGVASIRSKFVAFKPPGAQVLSTSHGKIDYTATAQVAQITGSIISSVGTYKITGGTGSYAHAMGTGTITVTTTSISGNKVVFDDRFS